MRGAGRVHCVPSLCHLKDPPVPCNPGNLPAAGGERVLGGSQALGLHSQPWSHIPALHAGVGLAVTARPVSPCPPLALSEDFPLSIPSAYVWVPGTIPGPGDTSSTITPKNLTLWGGGVRQHSGERWGLDLKPENGLEACMVEAANRNHILGRETARCWPRAGGQ